MKLVPIQIRELPKSGEIRLVLDEPRGGESRAFLAVWSQMITVVLVVAVGAAFLWYVVLEPALRIRVEPVVRVPRSQQVMPLEEHSVLRVGDKIFFPGSVAPNLATIAALPLGSVKARDVSGAERLMVLGVERYCVVTSEGIAHVLNRRDIRGVVRNNP